jgi:hypothetical protein
MKVMASKPHVLKKPRYRYYIFKDGRPSLDRLEKYALSTKIG